MTYLNTSENAPATGAEKDVFALTDEQILGMGEEAQKVESNPSRGDMAHASQGPSTTAATAAASARDDSVEHTAATAAQEPPGWLAREMKDPWVGDEARELWEGVQRAQGEAAAYREAFATPQDARALKEIYPGGVAEAKSAAERARELAEIDAVFFGTAGKPAEELRAGRAALVEKLYAQDPAAFREMVEAGVRILGAMGGRSSEIGRSAQDATILPGSLHPGEAHGTQYARSVAGAPNSGVQDAAGHSGRDDRSGHEQEARTIENRSALADGKSAQPGIIPQTSRDGAAVAVPQEVASRYREFERTTNAELEKSVGGTIARAMEAALPNLRQVGREGQAPPLQERLRAAVREEVETALRSDASLGEQVARILSGRRLDEAARAQVVRLIDARAQQLVPGAVRRVVGSWTQATLGARKTDAGAESAGRVAEERRVERTSSPSQRTANGDSADRRNGQTTAVRSVPRGRVDYRKMSDEQILGM